MSGFTKEEIEAEMKRRDEAIKGKGRWETRQGTGTTCLHCGSPMHSYEASDPENPLCDICLGD